MGKNQYLFRKIRPKRSTLTKPTILTEKHNKDKMNGSKYVIEKVLEQQGRSIIPRGWWHDPHPGCGEIRKSWS